MKTTHDDAVLQLLESANKASELTQSAFAGLAENIEEAIASPKRATVKLLSEHLAKALKRALGHVPDEVRRSILQPASEASNLNEAYALGQLNFAHSLVAHATELRVDDEFVNLVNKKKTVDLIRHLVDDEVSNVRLADLLGQKAETISRRLKLLRSQGVTDFRTEGQMAMNFLTPAARAAYHPNKLHEKLEDIVSFIWAPRERDDPEGMHHAVGHWTNAHLDDYYESGRDLYVRVKTLHRHEGSVHTYTEDYTQEIFQEWLDAEDFRPLVAGFFKNMKIMNARNGIEKCENLIKETSTRLLNLQLYLHTLVGDEE